ncbi:MULTISPECIES: hypothetical protein [Streptomyces]|uniref:hypothetical protein n=1 Tax=Streptomyces TaxID=1883 RepID=UPI0008538CF3|nr:MULTISPECIES: hypothetical protein [Streptomyces]
MARAERAQFVTDPTEQAAERMFEPKLEKLGLTREKIEAQSLEELQTTLVTVNHAIDHPDSFGVLKMKMTANMGAIIVRNEAEAHIEVGILPILLERKALILERINALRPTEQVRSFRQEVINTVTDPEMQEHLLKVLDERAEKEKDLSTRIEKESEENTSLMREMKHLREMFAVDKLQSRLEKLEEDTKRIESEKTSKFEALTIAMGLLMALGSLAGIILALVRWTTG